MRTYSNQFSAEFAPPPAILSALTAGGWQDTSWGDNVCPSWERPAPHSPAVFRFWCDDVTPAGREFNIPRFRLQAYATPELGGDCLLTIWEGENAADALAVLSAIR